MPPGIGDAVLDLVRLIKRIEFLIVTTPSLLAFETVKKQVILLCELKMPIIGVIENMKMDKAKGIAEETEKLGLKFLGEIPFDPQVEAAIGDVEKLLNTAVGKKIQQVADNNILAKRESPKMACTKAVIFDYVGTLVNCRSYTMEASREKLYAALVNEGFDVTKEKFFEAYIHSA